MASRSAWTFFCTRASTPGLACAQHGPGCRGASCGARCKKVAPLIYSAHVRACARVCVHGASSGLLCTCIAAAPSFQGVVTCAKQAVNINTPAPLPKSVWCTESCTTAFARALPESAPALNTSLINPPTIKGLALEKNSFKAWIDRQHDMQFHTGYWLRRSRFVTDSCIPNMS